MSPRPSFRLYAELNDHLPPGCRQREFTIELPEPRTVGAVLETLRVPASDVELILVDGTPADFPCVLLGNERVSVYPVFDSIDVGPVTRVQERPQRRMRFVLDVHLGKLARLLRLLGFDALYRNDASPGDLVASAREEDRILLSRGVKLTEKSGVNAAFRIKTGSPRDQLLSVMGRFDLWRSAVHSSAASTVMPCSRMLRKRPSFHGSPQRSRLTTKSSAPVPGAGESTGRGRITKKCCDFRRKSSPVSPQKRSILSPSFRARSRSRMASRGTLGAHILLLLHRGQAVQRGAWKPTNQTFSNLLCALWGGVE